jgi:hypothetical protein
MCVVDGRTLHRQLNIERLRTAAAVSFDCIRMKCGKREGVVVVVGSQELLQELPHCGRDPGSSRRHFCDPRWLLSAALSSPLLSFSAVFFFPSLHCLRTPSKRSTAACLHAAFEAGALRGSTGSLQVPQQSVRHRTPRTAAAGNARWTGRGAPFAPQCEWGRDRRS